MKRGPEIAIIFLVIGVAVIGIWSVMTGYGKASSVPSSHESCKLHCYQSYAGEQLAVCLTGCSELYAPESIYDYDSATGRYWTKIDVVHPGDVSPQESCRLSCFRYSSGYMLESCLNKCEQYSSVGNYYYIKPSITGEFVAPSAKAYGGDIRGVASSTSKAFAGRAYQMPAQACYTCSCLDRGITAIDKTSAERVCLENCQGTITEVKAGACPV